MSVPSNSKRGSWLCGSADIAGLALRIRICDQLLIDQGLSEIGGVTPLY